MKKLLAVSTLISILGCGNPNDGTSNSTSTGSETSTSSSSSANDEKLFTSDEMAELETMKGKNFEALQQDKKDKAYVLVKKALSKLLNNQAFIDFYSYMVFVDTKNADKIKDASFQKTKDELAKAKINIENRKSFNKAIIGMRPYDTVKSALALDSESAKISERLSESDKVKDNMENADKKIVQGEFLSQAENAGKALASELGYATTDKDEIFGTFGYALELVRLLISK